MTRALSQFEIELITTARDKRDAMVRDKVPCCINCKWAAVRPAFTVSEPDTFAAHYVQCTWPRLNILADCVKAITKPEQDPTMAHMAGTTCKVFSVDECTPSFNKDD